MRFRLRLMIAISLLIAISFGIGGTALITVSFRTALDAETAAAQDSLETVRNTLYLLNSLGEITDYDSISQALDQMSSSGGARWQALSLRTGDRILYQSGSNALLSREIPLPEPDQWGLLPVNDRYGRGLHILSVLDAREEYEYIHRDPFVLEARFDFSQVYETRALQQRLYLVIYGAVVLLGVLISFALSFAMTRPLGRLTAAARKIAGGDLSTRSKLRSHDEFGVLSRDFDAMADQLQENICNLEDQMQRQEAFMGAFAHELKTPMTSIIGYADLLRQNGLDDSTRMVAASYIFSEGQRLEKLSFKLLDLLLLRHETVTMREISLPAFLREIEGALAAALQERNIVFTCPAAPGSAVLEPDLVKSLLYNLVDNSAKAMDGAGTISLRGSPFPGGCRFVVTDNGRGMAEAELARITEAFYRVDKSRSRKQGGAGLGLALCKEIVALHQGTIEFQSAPGAGTRVTVTLYGKGEPKDV